MNEFFLGLDIGTNSVGFAVTDKEYNLLKLNGQNVWGVRLFDAAQTSVDRRLKRCNRRRLNRKKMQLNWLREIFFKEIEKVDSSFFDRLKYSNLFIEDKIKMNSNLKTKNSLFCDFLKECQFTDEEYYKDYKTIYHLRKELLSRPAKDVRLLYLALHNIVKNRGNFLMEGEVGENVNLKELMKQLIDSLYQAQEVNESFNFDISDKVLDNIDVEIIENCVEKNLGIKDTKNRLIALFEAKNELKAILEACINGKLDMKIFAKAFELEKENCFKIDFSSDSFETETLQNLFNLNIEVITNIVLNIQKVFNLIQLKKILKDSNYICESFVKSYENHHKQLEKFKKFITKYYKNEKYNIFRRESLNNKDNNVEDEKEENGKNSSFTNYSAYINSTLYNGEKRAVNSESKKRTTEDFYKYIKGIIESKPQVELTEDEYIEYEKERQIWLQEIENGTFLEKQRTKQNGVLPNKLYVKEVKKILETNKEKYIFLNDKDESGLTNLEKIIKIIEFRVPYFIGPIVGNSGKSIKSKNAWAIKTDDMELKPWTIEKIIDYDKSEDEFINKMTNKCSYLSEYDVMPKDSLTYQKFKLLNELNKLSINGISIRVETKQKIFNELFKEVSKVTVKNLKEFLKQEPFYNCQTMEEMIIGGIDKEFANNFSTYIKFKNLKGKDFVENNEEIIDDIVFFSTIISDKTRLVERIKRKYPDVFSDFELKQIKGFNFSKWGTLSNQFLNKFYFANKVTGERTTVLNELWETNYNLQEIIFSNNYTLQEELEKNKNINIKNINYEEVEKLYCSPSVKRGVWQAISIINEIKDIVGKMPNKIFIEVTRDDEIKGDGGRKLSRKTNLEKLYLSKDFKKSLLITKEELEELINELNKKENLELRSDKLYLYFMQCGRCAYSGEKINLLDITDESKYDIDHIIPQAITKDDSLNNKVLVKRIYNNEKSDTYPIYSKFPQWVNKMKPLWEQWVNVGLMSKIKFDRLIRVDSLTDEERNTFIARQIVETNQSAKAVIEFIKNLYKDQIDVVYSKASLVSKFRNIYEIEKCREINDLHHAKDAYLNIVVGNVVDEYFTKDKRNFVKFYNKEEIQTRKDEFDDEDPNKRRTSIVAKIFRNYLRSNLSKERDIIWKGYNDIKKVKLICEGNDCSTSVFSFKQLNGSFYDETIYKSKKNDAKTKAKISMKGDLSNPLNNIERYGGYNSAKTAYFVVIESEDKKHKSIKTIEAVPIYIYQKFKNDKNCDEQILNWLKDEYNLINPKYKMYNKKPLVLNFKSTIQIGKGEYLLGGKTGDSLIIHNANQWHANAKQVKYAKIISKYITLTKIKKMKIEEKDDMIIVSDAAKSGNKKLILTRNDNNEFYDDIICQLNKCIYRETLMFTCGEKLKERKNIFKDLSVAKQTEVLYELLKFLSRGPISVNLELIGGKKIEFKYRINKNITESIIKLITKSKTGLIRKTISL